MIFFGGLINNIFFLIERNIPKDTSSKVMEFNNILTSKFKYEN